MARRSTERRFCITPVSLASAPLGPIACASSAAGRDPSGRIQEEELEQVQIRLLGVWKQKQLVSRRLPAYDTTNFYTYVASTNTRNELAQRGHNKQGRHNLRQVGLSYVMDGDNGLSLCHHVYPGNRADVEELPEAFSRIGALLDRNQIARDSVTLVLDKGSAALANTLELEKAGVGWISALPWNQAPAELRDRSVEQLPVCGSSQPGVRAAAESCSFMAKSISVCSNTRLASPANNSTALPLRSPE
jgi:transposase